MSTLASRKFLIVTAAVTWAAVAGEWATVQMVVLAYLGANVYQKTKVPEA